MDAMQNAAVMTKLILVVVFVSLNYVAAQPTDQSTYRRYVVFQVWLLYESINRSKIIDCDLLIECK